MRRSAPQKWLTHLGCVTVEVLVPAADGHGTTRVLEASGSIAQVSALLYAADADAGAAGASAWRLTGAAVPDGCVTAGVLGELLTVPAAEAAGLLRFWVRKRVLAEVDGEGHEPAFAMCGGAAHARAALALAGGSEAAAASTKDDSAEAEEEEKPEQDVVGSAMLAQQTALVRNFGIGMMRSRGAMRLPDILVTLRTFASCEWLPAAAHAAAGRCGCCTCPFQTSVVCVFPSWNRRFGERERFACRPGAAGGRGAAGVDGRRVQHQAMIGKSLGTVRQGEGTARGIG